MMDIQGIFGLYFGVAKRGPQQWTHLTTAPERSCFRAGVGNLGITRLGTDGLRGPRMPSVLPSKSFRRRFFSALISKSTRRDTTAQESVVCTRVPTIPWPDA